MYEFFLKYISNNGNIPFTEKGGFDIQSFTGKVETFNAVGNKIGFIHITNGDVIIVNGNTSPCDDNTDNNPNDNDDDNDNGGGQADNTPIDDNTGSDNNGNDTGDGWYQDAYDCTPTSSIIPCDYQITNNIQDPQEHDASHCSAVLPTGTGLAWEWVCYGAKQGNNSGPCDDADVGILVDIELFDDCNELNKLSNDQEFINKMMDLKNKSITEDKEVGYVQKVDTTTTSGYAYDYFEEGNVDDEISITIPTNTPLKGYHHTHDDVDKHLPVFSPDDLYALFKLFNPSFAEDGTCTFNNTHSIEENFTMVLVTAHSTKLALKFDSNGREKLRQFGEKYFGDWHIDTSSMAQIPGITPETDRDIMYRKFEKIIKEKFDIEKKKKKFAKFLDKMDIGMSLYQANDNFTQWVKYNKSGNPTPCN